MIYASNTIPFCVENGKIVDFEWRVAGTRWIGNDVQMLFTGFRRNPTVRLHLTKGKGHVLVNGFVITDPGEIDTGKAPSVQIYGTTVAALKGKKLWLESRVPTVIAVLTALIVGCVCMAVN